MRCYTGYYDTIYSMLGSLEKATSRKETTRSAFPDAASEVTRAYFESLGDVVVEGNPELGEQVMQNIIRAEEENDGEYASMARELGLSVDVFKESFQSMVEQAVESSHFFVAIAPDNLTSIMAGDGYWKSQFATGASQGVFNPSYRARVEMGTFGFNKIPDAELQAYTDGDVPQYVLETDKEGRPVYGFFSDEPNGVINESGTIPPPTNLQLYGSIAVRVKKERALQKSTITFQDSFIGFDADSGVPTAPPTFAVKPHFTSFALSDIDYDVDVFNKPIKPSIAFSEYGYTEVQYHGGLSLDDIESIHISYDNEVSAEEVRRVEDAVGVYNEQHPDSPISLVMF